MKSTASRWLLLLARTVSVWAVVLACSLGMPGVAAAQVSAQPTRLTIQPLPVATVGTKVTVHAQLTLASGELVGALGNEQLELWVDGHRERRIRTGDRGEVDILIPSELAVGSHSLRLVYPGTRALESSETTAELLVVPAILAIKIVPPLANVVFRLDDQTFQSGADGVAKISIDTPGAYQLKIVTTELKTSDTHASFSRWLDDEFEAARQVKIPDDTSLQIGFNISHRISWSYVDLDNNPVDPARASSITVKGTHGIAYVFDDYEPQWLLATRTVRLQGGLEEAKIQWGVESVMVDGANTVNRGQHRFFLQPGDHWQIQLLLYSARFAARDAFFGFPVGSGFDLVYPDGQSKFFPSGLERSITATALARGEYIASIADAPGLAPPTPVSITREQDVQLKVISYFDLAVGAVALGSIGLGLLFIGRPHLLAWLPTPLRRKNGRMAPLWTTGLLLLVLIGVPTLATGYLLTVGIKTPVRALTQTGAFAGEGAASFRPSVLHPAANEASPNGNPAEDDHEPVSAKMHTTAPAFGPAAVPAKGSEDETAASRIGPSRPAAVEIEEGIHP